MSIQSIIAHPSRLAALASLLALVALNIVALGSVEHATGPVLVVAPVVALA
ncbi:hypothetical protein [Croceibacterium ferulae]|uniref:hypothetical protein n=1 Tax=Croceibacterium ferulae TaxID=1854641 RepID=UPI0012D7F3FE|nr:hypothetical protein [Croceibacterium ferulae]